MAYIYIKDSLLLLHKWWTRELPRVLLTVCMYKKVSLSLLRRWWLITLQTLLLMVFIYRVHKGQPVITTEVMDEDATKITTADG